MTHVLKLAALVLALAAPAFAAEPAHAGKDQPRTAAEKTKAADAEIGKSLDELRGSLERLGQTLGRRVDGDAQTASTWLTGRVDELSKALEDAGKKAEGGGGDVQEKAQESVATALKNLSEALDKAASLVKAPGDAKDGGKAGDAR